MPPQRSMTPFEWALLLLLSLLWGGSFFFVGVAVRELPPLTIVAVRVAIAAAILWTAAPLTGISASRLWAHAPALATMGLLNNAVPFALIACGQTRLPSGVASILNAATPIFTVVAAHFVTADEKLTPQRLGGAALGLVGVAALLGADLSLDGYALAELAILGAAASYAAASLYGRRFRQSGLAPIEVATGQVTASSLMLIPVALAVDRPWTLGTPSPAAMGALAAIGALSTALAYVVYFRILAGAGATNVVLVTLLAPATSILLGALLLGERLAPSCFAGLLLIGVGLALVDGRLFRSSRPIISARRS